VYLDCRHESKFGVTPPATLTHVSKLIPTFGFLETSMRKEMLNLAVDQVFIQRLLATGHAFDLERGVPLYRPTRPDKPSRVHLQLLEL
jgi:hypothetical protein